MDNEKIQALPASPEGMNFSHGRFFFIFIYLFFNQVDGERLGKLLIINK